MTIQYDGKIALATGRSRFETTWKNQDAIYSRLLEALSKSKQTPETLAEYMAKSKDEQDAIKDVGGFVGGHLKDGVRRNGNVECRQLITLDADTPPANLPEVISKDPYMDHAWAVYSTHKYGPGQPRYRFIAPLDRPVSPDEYEAIARKIAEHIGIDWFDDSTYQATRLMYFPSNPVDVVPVFVRHDAPWISADAILAEYHGHWQDTSYWPESSRQPGIRKALAAKQGNPIEKAGIVGAFCEAYDIPSTIEKFLPGVYIPTDKPDRYTYAAGSSSGGLVVYDGGLFAYSNHATDPASGKCCNAFDLVRIHLYGDKDDPSKGLSGARTESYKLMAELASHDEAVCRALANRDKRAAILDFKDVGVPGEDTSGSVAGGPGGPGEGGDGMNTGAGPGPDMSWEASLTRDKKGRVEPTVTNVTLILTKHPSLQAIKYNELARSIEVVGELPWDRLDKYWREADEAQLYAWIADKYHVQFPDNHFRRALIIAADSRRFSPLKDYVNGLPEWDGIERMDRLFIDYLGARDTRYVRAVTRASLIGAIMRALTPGSKHDTVLVLNGRPGIGKSTLLSKLGGEYYSDSLKLNDTRDKTAAEKLQGIWIMEIGEMQGSRKADLDNIKGFLSCQIDEYRPAYGRVVERRPRVTVIWGTTNNTDGFLRDTTGNRRFWPVEVSGDADKNIWDELIPAEVDQIWAEAKAAYEAGEPNFLDAEMENEAIKAQQGAMETDDREGLVRDYLDTLIPEEFYSWDASKRADYFLQPDHYTDEHVNATMPRTYISPIEIWTECFGKPLNRWERKCSYEINAIMACIPGWEKTGERKRVEGYGTQRVYIRKS